MAQIERVIGIDPGSRFIGIGVLLNGEIEKHFLLKYKSEIPIHTRCGLIFQDVRQVLGQIGTDAYLAIEETLEDFTRKNAKTDATLHLATGAILAAIYHSGFTDIQRIPAKEWITEFVGTSSLGGESKKYITRTATYHWGEEAMEKIKQDEVDALGVAYVYWRHLEIGDERAW